MARHVQLVRILDQLRAEARLSLNPAHNRQVRDTHVNMLQRIQDRLADDFAWPHMRVQRLVPLQAGQRYYSPPDDIRIDNIESIELFDSGGWQRLAPSISAEHYSAHNSDLDERTYPPKRWQIHEDEDVEIWPISDTNGNADTLEGQLKFTGIRSLKPFVQDSDRADLDDRLIVMFGAAELLAAAGAKDAQLKLDQANGIYRRLRSGLTPRRRFRMFGTGATRPPHEYVIFHHSKGTTIAAPGAAGPQGTRGSIWTTGTGAPAPGPDQLAGDMYLDEATGDVYRFDGTVWARRG